MDLDEFYRQLPTLHTRRLVLRKLRMQDAAAYFTFAGDPYVTRYLRWGPHSSLQETESYLAEVLDGYRQGTDGPWGIEFAQMRQLIGTIHLMDLDPRNLKADVGVVLHCQYWRQGIGSEALECVLNYCFKKLRLQRVQGLAITGNTAACRLMEKCRMAREGVLRRYALQKGKWFDFDLFSIVRDDG